MSGVINFLRNPSGVVGKLFYFGGEGLDELSPEQNEWEIGLSNHYFDCSKPDVQPYSCDECEVGAAYSDGSFVMEEGDAVYNIFEVENAILEYYNKIAPEDRDTSAYRPFRWKTISNLSSKTKYKTVKMFLDKDGDVWYLLAELKQPTMGSSNYIEKLRKHFEED